MQFAEPVKINNQKRVDDKKILNRFKLKQDVPIRWNSSFLMIKSILKLEDSVKYDLSYDSTRSLKN